MSKLVGLSVRYRARLKFKFNIMITRENFADLIRTIDAKTLTKEINKNHDFILLEAHFFNTGWFATIMSTDFSDELQSEAHSNGDLFCSKDNFLRLIEETQALEY